MEDRTRVGGDGVHSQKALMSRRWLLQRALLLGVSVPTVSALLAACDSAQSPTASTSAPGAGSTAAAASASAPVTGAKRGGILRIGVPAASNVLDTAKAIGTEEFMIGSLVYSKLTRVTADLKTVPD